MVKLGTSRLVRGTKNASIVFAMRCCTVQKESSHGTLVTHEV